jgi:hypothetical protein
LLYPGETVGDPSDGFFGVEYAGSARCRIAHLSGTNGPDKGPYGGSAEQDHATPNDEVNKQHMELAEATERPKLDPFKYADSFDCSGLHCALSRSVAARNRSIAPSVGYGWGRHVAESTSLQSDFGL